ncbi:phosphomevalonate kinase [Facklamia sp. 7083-14-GEN3]|uniref:phosphomevalonate kinase n=1 Tax=Facklamia sp. 7083-14-GEN3 TaxID=2973478 RepID=UPI00215D507E|nr:phosphomevalonate kinase [Facklamia sp. 7083-14-GEN3]MCR8969773.1 phosphomevalonate kinase [Facklamia sp. 7083-14-GEN3]
MNPEHCLQSAQTQTIKIPGKLYIAGEYAVLAPKQAAILIAVDQYLELTISKGSETGWLIENHQGDYAPLCLETDDPQLKVAEDYSLEEDQLKQWRYVIEAAKVAHTFLQESSLNIQNVHLHIRSQLLSESGKKYGLGSSGAVTVGTLKAILNFHGIKLSAEKLYRLAVISQLRLGATGSFGDIAANAFGGWTYYVTPDRQHLKKMIANSPSINALMNQEWPGLIIENLAVSKDLQVLIGWTQQTASTDNLVKQLKDQIAIKPQAFQAFLDQAPTVVGQLKEGLITNQADLIQQAISKYRHLLLDLGKAYDLSIETDDLNQLIKIGKHHGYASKSSGAGGGDCGIGLGYDIKAKETILNQWKKHGIMPLNLQVAPQAKSSSERME